MSEAFHFYEPARGHGLPHDPFKAIVAPRPIGWISSVAEDGTYNLAPYSFFNALNAAPPMIGFSSYGHKDSVSNIEQSGEFCWNLATRELAEAMNRSSAPVAPGVDEFELAGLATAPSRVIDAPRVARTPVSFECRLCHILRLESADGTPTDNWLVIGEVVGVHIAQDMLVDGIYDTARAEPIMRAGGPADYFSVSEAQRFRMQRPE
ncbi:flavin reductase (DIM6/NTAB) family NADH-FMN oxidoreductase RutF [Kushneria sinocarnis]|uniref:Flavin reductase (DIM6/NTAB) family NADH-FMN oxidoreductase RutF n=1 Tax=Kushneria sinocarnis TaxID=595502 RepID=A0A420X0L7_9GAMM|nr:flavin reductase family protein [Kushneria sinocarnis]RKR07314.1 flavin reductase (DIM6/NTAB) family NADH-FMN oxidoreductase RutF [Kushneria sinocarnis]